MAETLTPPSIEAPKVETPGITQTKQLIQRYQAILNGPLNSDVKVIDGLTQRYDLSLLGKRRRDPKLDLNISFRRGRINAQNTYVQAS